MDDFPFTDPSTASTINGGAIAALARQGIIDLWWVDPKGRLIKARYTATPGKWTDPTDLV